MRGWRNQLDNRRDGFLPRGSNQKRGHIEENGKMEVGRREEVDRQGRRPLWRRKEAGPLPAGEGEWTGSDLRRGLERADVFWIQKDEVS